MNILTCKYCGNTFKSVLQSEPGLDIVLNNVTTNCPKCHKRVSIVPDERPGRYVFDSEGKAVYAGFVDVFRGLNLPAHSITQLKTLVEGAKKSNLSLPDLTQQVEVVSPEFATLLNKFFEKNQYTIAALALLISILSYFKSDSPPAVTNNFYYGTRPEQARQEITVKRPPLYAAPLKRGNNLTPPLSKKAKVRKKNRRK